MKRTNNNPISKSIFLLVTIFLVSSAQLGAKESSGKKFKSKIEWMNDQAQTISHRVGHPKDENGYTVFSSDHKSLNGHHIVCTVKRKGSLEVVDIILDGDKEERKYREDFGHKYYEKRKISRTGREYCKMRIAEFYADAHYEQRQRNKVADKAAQYVKEKSFETARYVSDTSRQTGKKIVELHEYGQSTRPKNSGAKSQNVFLEGF